MSLFSKNVLSALLFSATVAGFGSQSSAQVGMAAAYQAMVGEVYRPGSTWMLLACPSQYGSFATVVGPNAQLSSLDELGRITDYSFIGKSPFETFQAPIFLVNPNDSSATTGSGTFDSYAAVVKITNSQSQTVYVAATVIRAQLSTTNYSNGSMSDSSGEAFYLVANSVHSDEGKAESSAAAMKGSDPGEEGTYPKDMKPDQTVPGPTVTPGNPPSPNYVPAPGSTPSPTAAADCYTTYKAACRDAFTKYKNSLATARNSTLNGAGAGAAAGGAVGGGIAGVVVVGLCIFSGPPGWAVGGGILAAGAIGGSAIGVVAGPVISYAEAKEAAKEILSNELDSAFAAYIKCLEGAGYRHS
ncbi:hypothetical protein BH11PLA1_BH11PLA1_01320 [soil metagenome]